MADVRKCDRCEEEDESVKFCNTELIWIFNGKYFCNGTYLCEDCADEIDLDVSFL